MRLSERIPIKACANPQTHDPNINRVNLYDNEMVFKDIAIKLLRSISY